MGCPSTHFRVVEDGDTPELLSGSISECLPTTEPLSPASLKGRPPKQSPGREEIRSAGTASDSAAGILPDQCADPERQRGGRYSEFNALSPVLAGGRWWDRGLCQLRFSLAHTFAALIGKSLGLLFHFLGFLKKQCFTNAEFFSPYILLSHSTN